MQLYLRSGKQYPSHIWWKPRATEVSIVAWIRSHGVQNWCRIFPVPTRCQIPCTGNEMIDKYNQNQELDDVKKPEVFFRARQEEDGWLLPENSGSSTPRKASGTYQNLLQNDLEPRLVFLTMEHPIRSHAVSIGPPWSCSKVDSVQTKFRATSF